MSDNVLEVKNLTKQFGSFTAVNNISFSLRGGEILGILGVNGAGKTTIIQMILGVLTPTSGDISYFGKNLKTHRSDIMKKVNFSSSYTNLPWVLSVQENLTFISYLYDIDDRKKRLQKIIDLFGLEPFLHKQIIELSAGQQTRVNLAKAFVNFPKVLLLDEPTASLDVEIAADIRKLLIEERNSFNTSIILTSHNMTEVEEVCDRVIFIDKGVVIADDTPDNLTKSIDISHVELGIKDGLKRAIDHCLRKKLNHRINNRKLIVDVEEHKIAGFLSNLAEDGITYDEISIDKPSLEDYFLQTVNKEEQI